MCDKIGLSAMQERDEYPDFLKSVEKSYREFVSNKTPLFTTDQEDLFNIFLDHLPENVRQLYTCTACKNFVATYGGLVTISDSGTLKPVFWHEEHTPNYFKNAVGALESVLLKSNVTGVFLSNKDVWGMPVTGQWHHLAVRPHKEHVYHCAILTPGQKMAERREDYYILQSALNEYPIEAVNQAITLLQTEQLYNCERCLGVAQWLGDLHVQISRNKQNRNNLLWRAVATAPAGYCHIKSTMIGTLLDDIIAGLSYESVSIRFAEKMDPKQYQRPQAPPSEGNVKKAEKIFENLKAEKSLERRFARLDELELLWRPRGINGNQGSGGLFSHLATKKKRTSSMEIPPVLITWSKFSTTVLPKTEKIEYLVKWQKANYAAIITAVHSDAPPIYQWDTLEKRNPFSWYVLVEGSLPDRWNLSPGYCEVTGVCLQPSMWYGKYPHQGKSIFFLLKDAKDKQFLNTGSAIFPAALISELRSIRSTIEAYSNQSHLTGYGDASACGIKLEDGADKDAVFRVTTTTGVSNYILDRWD